LSYLAPKHCDGAPTKESVSHFKLVMLLGSESGICEKDDTYEEEEDCICQDKSRNRNLKILTIGRHLISSQSLLCHDPIAASSLDQQKE